MRKEIIIAIVFGLLLAFVITVVINRASQVFRKPPLTEPLNTASPSSDAASTQLSQAAFVIHSPEDGLVQTDDTTIVAGSTDPNLPVILLVNDQEYLSTSDESGNFSFTAKLKNGGNVVTLYVLKDDGSSLTDQRTVIVGDFVTN